MNISEIKIGDWFEFSEGQGQINLIYGDTVIIDGYQLNIAELDPIPLTKEILRKNKFYLWKHYKDKNNIGYEFFEYSHPSFDNLILRCFTAENNNTFYLYDCNEEPIKVNFTYVHQLQHLLWAIGLDDNLKI